MRSRQQFINIFKTGRFENGKLNGFGEKTSLSKSNYVGEFQNNLKHGFGVDENQEHVYEGEFKNDKRKAKGNQYINQIRIFMKENLEKIILREQGFILGPIKILTQELL